MGNLKAFLRDDGASIENGGRQPTQSIYRAGDAADVCGSRQEWAAMTPSPTVAGTIALPGGVPIRRAMK